MCADSFADTLWLLVDVIRVVARRLEFQGLSFGSVSRRPQFVKVKVKLRHVQVNFNSTASWIPDEGIMLDLYSLFRRIPSSSIAAATSDVGLIWGSLVCSDFVCTDQFCIVWQTNMLCTVTRQNPGWYCDSIIFGGFDDSRLVVLGFIWWWCFPRLVEPLNEWWFITPQNRLLNIMY